MANATAHPVTASVSVGAASPGKTLAPSPGVASVSVSTGVPFVPTPTGMPTMTTQIALTGSAYAGTNWVTIQPFVLGFTSKRGRQHELQRAEAGQVALRLSNRDGRFNPWSTNSPYYNQLPPTDSNPTAGTGTWTATGAALSRITTPRPRYGSHCWGLLAGSGGTMSASSASRTTCVAGRTYKAIVYVLAGVSGTRPVKLSILWKNASGTVISTSTGAVKIDTTSTHVKWSTSTPTACQWTVRAVAPAGAVSKDLKITITTVTEFETHYFACAGVFDVTHAQVLAAVTQGWCVGQQAPFWPNQPIRMVAKWGPTLYPVFAGVVDKFTPKYGTVAGDMNLVVNDYAHLWANGPVPGNVYPALVSATVPELWWRLQTATGSTTALDSSGNGHTGTLSGSVAFDKAGYLYHTSTELSAKLGVSDTGGGKIAATLAMPSAWTVELIVKTTAGSRSTTNTGTWPIFTWGTGANSIALVVAYHKTLSPEIVLYHGGSSTGHSYNITSGSWNYICLTKTATGTVTVFISSTSPEISGVSLTGLSGSAFSVGGVGSSHAGTNSTYVEEVAVYPRVLTDAETNSHHWSYSNGYPRTLKTGAMIRALLFSAGVPATAIGTITPGTVLCKPPSTSTSQTGQTQLLSVLQTVEFTEQGMLFCSETGKAQFYSRAFIFTSAAKNTSLATVANDGTPAHFAPWVPPVPTLDDVTLFNVVTVGVEGSGTSTGYVTRQWTPTSRARYGPHLLTGFTGMYFATDESAYQLAIFLLGRFASPLPRVRSVTLSSVTGNGVNLAQMLGRKLLDSVTVWWQPTDGTASPFVQTAQIEQITHQVDKETWTTTWVLAIPG